MGNPRVGTRPLRELRDGLSRFADFLAYLRRVNDLPSTPRNPWEIMYLPPVDRSWALRDTH
ncbi:MAG: hypothetical protein JWO75_1173, partial [Actinomycetia bacterium]|nr:hypothetical protein [Actinomycetes bacterium]